MGNLENTNLISLFICAMIDSQHILSEHCEIDVNKVVMGKMDFFWLTLLEWGVFVGYH
jgi:hypothetical protein